MTTTSSFWRRCSNCKNPIALQATYWMCSVASCSKARAPVQFCKPDCWAVHEEIAFHKNAWAVEQRAPATPDPEPASQPARPAPAPSSASAPPTMVPQAAPSASTLSSPPAPSSSSPSSAGEREVLVVVSRLKELIKTESGGMSTSDQVVGPFSDHVRKLVDRGIQTALAQGRRTLLDRDIPTEGAIERRDVVIVVSKLKEYVRRQAPDLRTSDDVPVALTHELRRLALWAIESARKAGRKTVMARDIQPT